MRLLCISEDMGVFENLKNALVDTEELLWV